MHWAGSAPGSRPNSARGGHVWPSAVTPHGRADAPGSLDSPGTGKPGAAAAGVAAVGAESAGFGVRDAAVAAELAAGSELGAVEAEQVTGCMVRDAAVEAELAALRAALAEKQREVAAGRADLERRQALLRSAAGALPFSQLSFKVWKFLSKTVVIQSLELAECSQRRKAAARRFHCWSRRLLIHCSVHFVQSYFLVRWLVAA